MSTEKQRILVRGSAEVHAPADLAALSVQVLVDDEDQATAFARASEVAGAVDVVLAQKASALGPRQAAVVVVQPTTRWVDGEQLRTGWRASRTTSLDVTALDQLGSLIAELVGAGALVHGPTWRLRPDHPALGDARTAAAADARLRADDYAVGLGLQVGRVEWIAEPGLRATSPGGIGAAPAGAAMRAEVAGDPELAVAPAELTITASVEVAFAIDR